MSTSVKRTHNHNKYRYTNIIREQTLEIHNSFTETRTKADPNVRATAGVVWGKCEQILSRNIQASLAMSDVINFTVRWIKVWFQACVDASLDYIFVEYTVIGVIKCYFFY